MKIAKWKGRSDARTASRCNEPKPSWSLEAGALWLHNMLRWPCLSWIFIDRCETNARRVDPDVSSERWDKCRGMYVIGWTVVLIGVWFWNPGGFLGRMIVGGVAAYRAYEIVISGLGTTLEDATQTKARNLITIAFYAVQLTLIFAIAYHSFAGGCFQPATGSHADPHLASSDYLYISWATFTSLGQNTYEAKSATAEFLEVSTTSMGILLLAVLLAFGINEVRDPTRRGSGKGGLDR